MTTLNNAKAAPSNLNKQEQSALRDLKSDQSIIVLPADKGKGTVILDKETYHDKMMDILRDTNHFVLLTRDPTPKSEGSLVDHLCGLKKKSRMGDVIYRRLFSSDECTPKMYGLPKIHKPECPLRPIVSFIGSPTYNLSKYFAELISSLTGNNNLTVWNSQEFVGPVRDEVLNEKDIMVSFSDVSLFTSVPTAVAVEVAETRFKQDDLLSGTQLAHCRGHYCSLTLLSEPDSFHAWQAGVSPDRRLSYG